MWEVLSCCPPNVQARLNVSACGDPVLGHVPTGGDGELDDLIVFGLCHLLAFYAGGGETEQGGVDASTDDAAAPHLLHYLISSLKCSRCPSNWRVKTLLKAQLYLQNCSLLCQKLQGKGWVGGSKKPLAELWSRKHKTLRTKQDRGASEAR